MRGLHVLLVTVVVTVGLVVPVESVAAPEGPQLVANGNFASPDLSSWQPTGAAMIGRTREASFQASHALEVTSGGVLGGGVQTAARHATDPGSHVLTLAVKGTASSVGQVVRASITDPATGQTSVSAPVHLQPWWQTVGVTATTTGSPLLFAVHEEVSGGVSPATPWSAGDTWVVDAVKARAQGPTVATTRGRQLLVDGQPYRMHGYNYQTQPVGGAGFGVGPSFNTNPAQCQSDANLLQAAGVNTLRILYSEKAFDPITYRQCMDAFHAAGVGLMWLVNFFGVQTQHNAAKVEDTDLYVEAFWTNLQLAVERLKDHPATLGYVISNEVSRQQPQSRGWFDQLDVLARRTKQTDPHHVTSTSINSPQFFGAAGPGGDGVGAGDVPNIDLWGFNHYGNGNGYPASLWDRIIDQDPSRPVWISEFGTDRYRCNQDFGTIFDPLFLFICGVGSGIAQEPQAEWNGAQWSDIAANLSANDPDAAVVGGTLFMWSDLWWFSFPIFTGGVTTPATHEVQGLSKTNPINFEPNHFVRQHFPDQHFEPEWIGSTLALPVEAPGPRATSLSYDRMGSLYRGTPGPTVSSLQVDSGGACDATLSWTTDMPTVPRVDYGQTVDVVRENVSSNLIMADNFLTTDQVQGTTPANSHVVTLADLLPGTEYRAHVRGFDTEGRSGTRPPIEFTTATGACASVG